jgi:hypothetical protein
MGGWVAGWLGSRGIHLPVLLFVISPHPPSPPP